MALTLARQLWLIEAIATLEDAIATGALRVKYADRDVTYRSGKEMGVTLAGFRRELMDRPAPRQVRFQTSKGL